VLICAGFEIDWSFGGDSVGRIVGPSDIVSVGLKGDGVGRAYRSVDVRAKTEHEGRIAGILLVGAKRCHHGLIVVVDL
jgi:hypothetical protein